MNDSPVSGDLKPVSAAALMEFDTCCAAAEAEASAACMTQDNPQVTMGPDAPAMIARGMQFVSKMARAMMQYGANAMMHDEVNWGRNRLPVYGVPPVMVLNNLKRYTESLLARLSPAARAEIAPYFSRLVDLQRIVCEAADGHAAK